MLGVQLVCLQETEFVATEHPRDKCRLQNIT